MIDNKKIAVVIPCFKVGAHILQVIKGIGPEVDVIYVIDDCCPENSGDLVLKNILDQRVKVLFQKKNTGVGGGVIRGYKAAIDDNIDIIVKIDGDGQMNPSLIHKFAHPLIHNLYDYTKGNRFHELIYLQKMPKLRIFGNALLSFINKFSSGYWNIVDPTNGYTAINIKTLKTLPLEKISYDYFFETDMLFRLALLKAKVLDIPIKSIYKDEKSNLKVKSIIFKFIFKHFKNFNKRFFYNYILRDVSIGTFEFIFGLIFLCFGLIYGGIKWYFSITSKIPTPTGTIVICAILIILGFQLLLAYIHNDIQENPNKKNN
jgi:glycosyltransferase involved in cell wall biosynthesis